MNSLKFLILHLNNNTIVKNLLLNLLLASNSNKQIIDYMKTKLIIP